MATESDQPWQQLPAQTVIYLRHRLARWTNGQIAGCYGVADATVRSALSDICAWMRLRGLRCPDTAAAMVLALSWRLEPLDLPRATDVGQARVALDEAGTAVGL